LKLIEPDPTVLRPVSILPKKEEGSTYNLAGWQVSHGYHGIYIKDRKKIANK
jgi:hypothetical protein